MKPLHSTPHRMAKNYIPQSSLSLRALAVSLALFTTGAWADETSFPASFDPFPYSFGRVGGEYRLGAGTGYTFYYIAFERTTDLRQPFATIALSLGSPAPLFGYTPALGEPQGFFHLQTSFFCTVLQTHHLS